MDERILEEDDQSYEEGLGSNEGELWNDPEILKIFEGVEDLGNNKEESTQRFIQMLNDALPIGIELEFKIPVIEMPKHGMPNYAMPNDSLPNDSLPNDSQPLEIEVDSKLPSSPPSNVKPTTTGKLTKSIKGIKPPSDLKLSQSQTLDWEKKFDLEFEKRQKKNKEVAVKANYFGKSNFEKEITAPINKALEDMRQYAKSEKVKPEDYFRSTIKGLLDRIDVEINEQYQKQQDEEREALKASKSAKKKHEENAAYHKLKSGNATKAKVALLEGFAAWADKKGDFDTYVRQEMWNRIKNTPAGEFFEEVATSTVNFNEVRGEVGEFFKNPKPELVLAICEGLIQPGKKVNPGLVLELLRQADSAKCKLPLQDLIFKKWPQEQVTEMIFELIKEEAILETDVNKIFRGNSPAATLASQCNVRLGEGKFYYSSFIKEAEQINKTVLPVKDPEKTQAIMRIVDQVFVKILKSPPPRDVTAICQILYDSVLQNTNNLKAAELAVMGHLVLRVISPAISSLAGNGKVVSQIIQAIANKTTPKVAGFEDYCLEKQPILERYIYEKVLTSASAENLFEKAWGLVNVNDPESFGFALSVAARLGMIDMGRFQSFNKDFMKCREVVNILKEICGHYNNEIMSPPAENAEEQIKKAFEIRLDDFAKNYVEKHKLLKDHFPNAAKALGSMQIEVDKLNKQINLENQFEAFARAPARELNEALPKDWKRVEID